jgi:hypothetical protein
MPKLPALMLFALSASSIAAASEPCSSWADPVKIGELDNAVMPEASGLAVSHGASSLYHVNDGGEAAFHVTSRNGGAHRRVGVAGFTPRDIEDIALGPCAEGTCLYLADIGDNTGRRPFVQIAVVEEAKSFGDRVTARRVIRVRYPDRPHDAEAIAIHPSGDLFLVTKARLGQQAPAHVYRLAAAQLAAGGEQTFEALGTIPVPDLTDHGLVRRRVVTAMDIAPDGERFVLLTYDSLIELAFDLREGLPGDAQWIEGRTHRAAPLARVIQAEAIAYDDDGRSVLYSTESILGSSVPLIRQACLD